VQGFPRRKSFGDVSPTKEYVTHEFGAASERLGNKFVFFYCIIIITTT
jgi:hypothetical protein